MFVAHPPVKSVLLPWFCGDECSSNVILAGAGPSLANDRRSGKRLSSLRSSSPQGHVCQRARRCGGTAIAVVNSPTGSSKLSQLVQVGYGFGNDPCWRPLIARR